MLIYFLQIITKDKIFSYSNHFSPKGLLTESIILAHLRVIVLKLGFSRTWKVCVHKIFVRKLGCLSHKNKNVFSVRMKGLRDVDSVGWREIMLLALS